MRNKETLFRDLLGRLHSEKILQNIILIGNWVLPIYRHYFNNAPEIPLLRTTDIDFLIPNPPKIRKTADVPKILEEFGFEQVFSVIGDFSKFVHPQLEIEFIIPELGKGSNKAYWVKELNISAQPLRYLHLIQKFTLEIKYLSFEITVPEPAVFVLLKFLLIIKRKDKRKIDKDIYTAKELADYLLSSHEQKNLLLTVYDTMPNGWKKKLNPILKEHCFNLYEFLRD